MIRAEDVYTLWASWTFELLCNWDIVPGNFGFYWTVDRILCNVLDLTKLDDSVYCMRKSKHLMKHVFKFGHPGLFWVHFDSFQIPVQFYNILMWRNIHQASKARIQTHNQSITSLLSSQTLLSKRETQARAHLLQHLFLKIGTFLAQPKVQETSHLRLASSRTTKRRNA